MSQPLQRGIAVLELLDSHSYGLGVREIARRLEMPPSNAQRLLATLERADYVDRLEGSRMYRLSVRAYSLGQSALRSDRLSSSATPVLQRLAIENKVSAYLAVRRRDRAVYLQVWEGHGVVSTHVTPGDSAPLHSTAMGKVLLAASADNDIARIFPAGSIPKITPRTVASLQELMEQIREIRLSGLSKIVEENLFGIAAIAAPIKDYTGSVIASLSIALPTSSRVDIEMERLAKIIGLSAREISELCGYTGAS